MKTAQRRRSVGWEQSVLMLERNESRDGFCWIGRGRSLHVNGPETEKARTPTVQMSLARGMWRLRVLEAERKIRAGV